MSIEECTLCTAKFFTFKMSLVSILNVCFQHNFLIDSEHLFLCNQVISLEELIVCLLTLHVDRFIPQELR